MNKVVLIGRLVRDVELRYIQNGGTAVANVTIAVDKRLSAEKRQEFEAANKPTADFINLVFWGKLAETLATYTEKGSRIGVEGRIETGSYENDKGQRIYTTDVVVSDLTIIDWKNNNSGQNNSNNQTSQQPKQNQQTQQVQHESQQSMNSFGQEEFGGVEGFNQVNQPEIPF